MAGIALEFWSERVLAVQGDQSPRPPKASMLATHDAVSPQL